MDSIADVIVQEDFEEDDESFNGSGSESQDCFVHYGGDSLVIGVLPFETVSCSNDLHKLVHEKYTC